MFWVSSLSELFVSGFCCDQWKNGKVEKYFSATQLILSLVFLGGGNFDARYFFGSKISGLCIFLGLQYEAPSDPPVNYTSSIPPGY